MYLVDARKKGISKAEKSKVMVTAHLCAPRLGVLGGGGREGAGANYLGACGTRGWRCHFCTKILIHLTLHMSTPCKCTCI